MKDLKYIAAYSVPMVAFLAISSNGIYTYMTVAYTFIVIPIIELFSNSSKANLSEEQSLSKNKKTLFDWLLYLNIPIVFGLLIYALLITKQRNLETYEHIGIILSLGIVLGSNGINVAHELGHRPTIERFLGKLLLLPSYYMHFFIEHNYGHHLLVATPDDPATSKRNQMIYHFWITSVIGQYFSAWKIQTRLLKNKKNNFLSIYNDMLWYTLITIIYLSIIYLIFGTLPLLIAIASGIVGFLLLETINYIEHYGLLRKKTSSGRYERVTPIHSWNSNHTLGRILLYELTRHSDHHHRASKKYQILEHHDQSPQLPFGYPTSMVLSLFPPLWFYIMNKRIPDDMKI